jgi:hypothetical protein
MSRRLNLVPPMQRSARRGGLGARPRRGNGVDRPGIRETLVETGAVQCHGNLDLFVPDGRARHRGVRTALPQAPRVFRLQLPSELRSGVNEHSRP